MKGGAWECDEAPAFLSAPVPKVYLEAVVRLVEDRVQARVVEEAVEPVEEGVLHQLCGWVWLMTSRLQVRGIHSERRAQADETRHAPPARNPSDQSHARTHQTHQHLPQRLPPRGERQHGGGGCCCILPPTPGQVPLQRRPPLGPVGGLEGGVGWGRPLVIRDYPDSATDPLSPHTHAARSRNALPAAKDGDAAPGPGPPGWWCGMR